MLKNSHILVTGANGFVGHHLCIEIEKTGATLFKVVRPKTPVINQVNSQIEIDLSNRKVVSEAFSALQPDYVIHLASEKNRCDTNTQFRDSYDKNLSISLNVIEACLALPKFKRFIFLGSCDEYGNQSSLFFEKQCEAPLNAYGLSKLAVTKTLSGLSQSSKFPSIVLRPSVIYGPNQGNEMLLSALIQSLLAKKNFPMTHGEQYRDFIYINDVVKAILKSLAADSKVNGSIINIGAGTSWQVKNVASLIGNLIDLNANSYINFGAVPYRLTEVMNYGVKIELAEELLGWRPETHLAKGLQETINYFRTGLDDRSEEIASCS